MSRRATRDEIVEAADRLFYHQGYEHTSFADIAAAVQISRGNFYHHFKMKDDILDAVIEQRLATTRAMLDEWQAAGTTPIARIRLFIEILLRNRDKIMAYGCPVGTLAGELAKLDHPSRPGANALFALFRDWLARQFTDLGLAAEAEQLALHLLARSQGVATLANAFHDTRFVDREVDQMCAWLDGLGAEPPSQ